MQPKCSFIVSAFNRPDHLAYLLYSLKVQTEESFDALVTDNGAESFISEHYADMFNLGDSRFSHSVAGQRDGYESANWGAEHVTGEYLCFPSDDGYYCPRFLELMLRHGDGADLIYCNCIWDGRGYGPGEECIHLITELKTGKIDKGGFLVKRERFLEAGGFSGPFGTDRCADGELIERLVRAGVSTKKVEITGWVHN